MRHLRFVALAVVAVSGLAADAAAQKRINCGPDVQVSVSIAGSNGAPALNALVSDGGGDYRNSTKGSDRITAIFQVTNCTHDFTMNLNSSRRSMWALLVNPVTGPFVRRGNFFNFDRVASVPRTDVDPLTFADSPFCQYSWAPLNADGSLPMNADGTYRDNYGGCGTDSYGNYVRRGGIVTLDGDESIGFATSPLDTWSAPYTCPDVTNPSCQADYIRVYHPTATTWILRPEGTAQATYRVGTPGGSVFKGFQSVPFEIMVTRP